MLYGAENSQKKKENTAKYNAFFSTCTIHNIDPLIAKEYAVLRKILKDKGKPIPENDIWIAAMAKHLDFTLVTTDCHFKSIDTEIKIIFFDK